MLRPVLVSSFFFFFPSACGPARPLAPVDGPPLLVGRSDAGAARAGAEGVRFGHPSARVGARWRVHLTAESRSDDERSEYVSAIRVEVLAIDGPAPSRLSVHVETNVTSFNGAPTYTPVHGKDYVVDATAPHVRDRTGPEAPAEEARRVLDWFPDLGARFRVDEAMPDEPMHVGDRRDELAAAILRVVHPSAWRLEGGAATLSGVDVDAATFDVALDAVNAAGMRMHLAGPARVRLRDSFLVHVALDGTYEQPRSNRGTVTIRRRID